MRAQSRAQQVNEQLATLRKRDLIADTAGGAKRRAIYMQLRDMADAETRLISSLSTKLRLVDQSNVRKALATAEREKMAHGPRPWDTVSHSDSTKEPIPTTAAIRATRRTRSPAPRVRRSSSAGQKR